ncbi:CLUMA_CG018871, isoform A [Clunio marinus]|uniref:CLUMA_CG018871, isoform A n=1 Tax=Clunio marinus TaxID=568069 RepID=A0A1J1J063_9DIPT|nr:CLUMA_CG018871, isoform A [Clunio marinus]
MKQQLCVCKTHKKSTHVCLRSYEKYMRTQFWLKQRFSTDSQTPPEISVEKPWVHAGEGHEAQLVCIVHGEANPELNNF